MRFVSKYPRLQMTMKAEIKREINGEILREPTKIIQFQDGSYETIDEKEIEFIKNYMKKNVDIVIDESEKYQKKATPAEETIIEKSRR